MTENHSNRKCEISVENRDFFIPLAFGAPLWEGGPCQNTAIRFGVEKVEWVRRTFEVTRE